MSYSVSYITKYISSLFASDRRLSSVSVTGEVSNLKYHTSGHVYFTLKDADAALSAVMFRSARDGLAFPMKDGDRVVVSGQIRVYEKGGRYELYARLIEPDGEGALYQAFERLKKKLLEMGMFDEQYKLPIPPYASRIGVVTAPTGAVIRDIIRITRRRNPYVQLILFPAVVQGESAAASISEGIRTLEQADVDVIIVGRGGGSIEDLWAFNEEEVAQAIFSCGIPVISAVGHETDVTIADFVADRRAATPSEAAELAVYDVRLLQETLGQIRQTLLLHMETGVQSRRQSARELGRRIGRLDPSHMIEQRRMRLLEVEDRIGLSMERRLKEDRQRLSAAAARLTGLSPAARLAQGYAYLTDADGHNIKDASALRPGDVLTAALARGSIKASVTEVSYE